MAIALVVVLIVVLRLSLSNRVGGEPKRSWLRRSAATSVAPSDAPSDAFADDLSLTSDPNYVAMRSNSNAIQNNMQAF